MLKDGWSGVARVDGQECCCVISQGINGWLLGMAVPTGNLYSGNGRAVFWAVMLYLMVSGVALIYAIIIRTDRHRRGEKIDIRVMR